MWKSPKNPSRSTILWTIPKPANVLSYSYLWRLRWDGDVTPFYGLLPKRLFRSVLDAVIAGTEEAELKAE
ncbi:hypothetical protein J2W40_001730 [Sphingobium xenophagum]|jgi:hypothetical protein|uniref:Uncharacterized protein n=1 Tax=Sphingobium xenophagum TaxID=121428 RepID=A0ABU1X146_SPHXE|nr:hypothetical protein [Sphingobium xenophagum]